MANNTGYAGTPPPGFADNVFADEYAQLAPLSPVMPPIVPDGFTPADPGSGIRLHTVSRYDHVMIRNTRLVDIADRITKISVALSTQEQSQITIHLDDPDFHLLESGAFIGSPPVSYQGLRLEVAGVATKDQSRGALEIACRNARVQALKKRRGPLIVRGGPREFIGYECQQVGMPIVTDTSDLLVGGTSESQYEQTSRDWQPYLQATSIIGDPDEIPSSWTTFKRLAQARGWLMFETANVLYFCPPSWLFQHARITRVRYSPTEVAQQAKMPPLTRAAYGIVVGSDGIARATVLTAGGRSDPGVVETIAAPECTYSQDQRGTTISFKVAAGYEGRFLPGGVVDLEGVPYFNGLYLTQTVDYDLDGTDVTVTAATPVDQQPQQAIISGYSAGTSATSGVDYGAGSTSEKKGLPVCAITMDSFLRGLRKTESGVYDGRPSSSGGPSGAYQFSEGDWQTWLKAAVGQGLVDKYPQAYQAPPDLQDQVARFKMTKLQERYDGDWGKMAVYHFYPLYAEHPEWWHFIPGQEPGGPGAYPGNPTAITYIRRVLRNAGGQVCAKYYGKQRHTRLATDFVNVAVSQTGKRYVYGASPTADDPNPAAFDCSSLVQWAAARVGVGLTRTSGSQWLQCQSRALDITEALHIRGALLFKDQGSIPGGEHVGISMGDGKNDMAAHDPTDGVNVAATTAGYWDRAALIVGMVYPGRDQAPGGAGGG